MTTARPRRPENFDYQTYLASREWSLLRERVRARSGNTCEHCYNAPQQAVHHLTYERIGHEKLIDLLAVCRDCHEFLSGKSDVNPMAGFVVVSPWITSPFMEGMGWAPEHLIIPIDAGSLDKQTCRGAGCIWCSYADANWPHFMFRLRKG